MSKSLPDKSADMPSVFNSVRCGLIESRLGLDALADDALQALILQWPDAVQTQYEQHPLTIEFSCQL